MGRYRDLTGQKFGRLTAVEIVGKSKSGNKIWLCKCECGNLHRASQGNLACGNIESCGCLNIERTKLANTKHGLARSRLYNIWRGMRKRCLDTRVPEYKNYGGRGISICLKWLDFVNFASWAKSNGYEDGLTIERIDNDGNYDPNNCKWISLREQARNRRSSNFILCKGVIKTLVEWSEITGIHADTIAARIKRHGWSTEKALTVPTKGD